jgi:hypothetical protein
MNIHGINENNRERPINRRNLVLLGANPESSDPRNDTFIQFLKDILCPRLTPRYFIFIITVIDIAIYITTLLFGIKRNPLELLAPEESTLDSFGMKVFFIFILYNNFYYHNYYYIY